MELDEAVPLRVPARAVKRRFQRFKHAARIARGTAHALGIADKALATYPDQVAWAGEIPHMEFAAAAPRSELPPLFGGKLAEAMATDTMLEGGEVSKTQNFCS